MKPKKEMFREHPSGEDPKKSSRTAFVVAIMAILASVFYSTYRYFGSEQACDVPESYLETKAVVMAVYPPRITRYGARPAQYDIRFLDQHGNEWVKLRQELQGGLQINDSITIYYNLDTPSSNLFLGHQDREVDK